MSARQQIFLTAGVMMMVMLSIGMSFYYTTKANDNIQRSEQTNQEIKQVAVNSNKKITEFVDTWKNRINVSNKVNNVTQSKIQTAIDDIKVIESELVNNLTQHRIIANETRDITLDILNATQNLINNLNQTNEEGREAAVNKIIASVENNTKLLQKLTEKQ